MVGVGVKAMVMVKVLNLYICSCRGFPYLFQAL